jgi:hypothetical protein
LTAAPVLQAALSAVEFFPKLDGMTDLANFVGGPVSANWTIPTGLSGGNANVNVYQTGASGANADYDLKGKGASGTANMVLGAPATGVWTGGSYWIQAWDANGGKVFTNYRQ